MKLVKSSFEIIEQDTGIEGLMQHIERCARTCYKSEDKITEESAPKFVDMLINRGHCYTGDVEILTKDGFIRFDKYKGEEVAVVTPFCEFKGYESPLDIINTTYIGKFYQYETLGLKVTDKHRMFGMFADRSEDRYRDFEGGIFECNSPYQDANKRSKTLGERWFKVKTNCNFKNFTFSPFCQLVGFWLGDGVRNYSSNVLCFHLKKERKVSYLTDLCLRLGFDFEYSNYKFKIYRESIGTDFEKSFTLNLEKFIDLNYTDSLHEMYSIIDGMLNSDGSIQKTGISFSNTSQHLIKYILSKGPLVGYNVTVGKQMTSNDIPVERLFLLKSDTKIVNDSRKPKSRVIITEEELPVYCVTVSTGLIIVRGANGVISICGNCAAVEHGTVYLKIANTKGGKAWQLAEKYRKNKYSSVTEWVDQSDQSNRGISYTLYCITTNYRVLLQNNWLDDLQYQCEPTEHHEKRVTVKFICDRGVSHEFVRHRVFSFAQESTRRTTMAA